MTGSEDNQPRYFFFGGSLPASLIGVSPRVLAVKLVWIPVQPYASSSWIRLHSMSPRPAPPYSAGSVGFTRPSSGASSKTPLGKLDPATPPAALGSTSSPAKRRVDS